jgi:uncharacterized Fe-S center protein
MPSKVFFGTARQARLEAKETLPAKLDLILNELHLRDRVDKETVAIKMHTGNNMVYSTIHPVLSTFEPGKAVHLNLATHMTPVCDCFGFTSMPILPDAGVFGSDDIVALETATLDVIGRTRLIEDNIPTSMEIHTREGHPFQWLHGPLKDPYKVTEFAEKLGLGTREYELVDVLPLEFPERKSVTYIAA